MNSNRSFASTTLACAALFGLGSAAFIACSSSDAPPGSGTSPDPTPTTMPPPSGTGDTKPPGSTAPPDPTPDPGPPAVRYIGRFDTRDAAGPIAAWPGTRIVANFEGTAVSVKLNEFDMPDGPSEWDVAIDGQWKTEAEHLVMQLGTHDYDVAKDLPSGKHTVELFKRTESQSGRTQMLGFDFHGGTLLPPPLPAQRRVEIVGDSEVAGYGYAGAFNGGNCAGKAWEGRYQNFHASWASLVGNHFAADVAGTVYSGKGFYYNAWRPDNLTMGKLFPRANPEDETSLFDFKNFQADAVVVSLGGNDFNLGSPEDTGPPPIDAFTDKVRELVTMVRDAQPNAHIFLMAYAVLSDADPPGRMKRTNVTNAMTTAMNEHHAAGDAKVYFISPPEADYTELTACDGHGGPEYMARIATFVQAAIAAKTGWR